MTDEQPSPSEQIPADDGGGGRWQLPALLLSLLMLVGSLSVAVATTPDPDFDAALDRAEALIDDGSHREAIALLNDPQRGLFDWIAKRPERVSIEDRRRYHVLIARAIFLGQRVLGLDDPRNHETVVREYREAERQGAALSPVDVSYLASTYVARREYELALNRVETIPDAQREHRDRVYREVVEAWLGGVSPDLDRTGVLLGVLLTDPALPTSERIWALDKQADVRLRLGRVEEAISRLLRALPRLDEAEPADLGVLHTRLGEAYLQAGEVGKAEARLMDALALTPEADPRRGRMRVLLGRVGEARTDYEFALQQYDRVVASYPLSGSYRWGLLGAAEAHAALGSPDRALEVFDLLATEMATGEQAAGPEAERVASALVELSRAQRESDRPDVALRYAELALRISGGDARATAGVLDALARAHETSALQLAGRGWYDGADWPGLSGLEPATRAQVRRHLSTAARYQRLHADRFILQDNEAYADSLWRAGVLFDRAGDQSRAVLAFNEYAEGQPLSDRLGEGRFRLGRSYQAMGEFDLAAAQYRMLLDGQDAGIARTAGIYATQSYVPLAQCLLSDRDPENDAEAEDLLLATLSGRYGGTGTPQYREALLELGSLRYEQGQFARAAERFGEAAQRYEDDPERASVVYRLGDTLRLLAQEVEARLEEEWPASERRAMEAARDQHLRDAMARLSEASELFEAEPQAGLGVAERLKLRNARFYIADCAYDLGDYEAALKLYDRARQRYPRDAASLVAMVQIVNTHMAMGDLRRARTANERARRFFASVPDSAWDDPTLPMDREAWERWLDASAALYSVADGGGE
ncbi:MAG: tetratricopeptide repeat protein [Planctomycetota bacterium]